MTSWKVTWTRAARNYYEGMTKDYQRKVKQAVKELEIDPFSSKNVRRLHGELANLE